MSVCYAMSTFLHGNECNESRKTWSDQDVVLLTNVENMDKAGENKTFKENRNCKNNNNNKTVEKKSKRDN